MARRATSGEIRLIRVLADTDVLLDVLLARQPWLPESAALWQAHEDGQINANITATTITNIFYVVRRSAGLEQAMASVRICLDTFEIIAVDSRVLEDAADLTGSDFEDNVQIACATSAGLDMIVTRNVPDFRSAPMPVLTPADLRARLSQPEEN
jgi:predicted nucleic acid-binding protein